jgi:NTP pyrophosphatase (non-canonical NTP hydrolase)
VSLFVVALEPGESELLTLGELTELRRRTVAFEVASHPLRGVLDELGVTTSELSSTPDASDDSAAVVISAASPLLVQLADAGAKVSVGAAETPDAMTAVAGARVGRRAAKSLGELALVMARLRGPGGCPWDHEQTHESLQVHLLEEAHEVLEAIDEGKVGAELEEELGDLLLQVVFHAQMAADDGRFDITGVARGIVAKLVHRHPHVFSDVSVAGASEVVANWETIKAAEKQERTGPFDGIPSSLPALLSAQKTQKRAAALGFDGSEARSRLDAALASEDVGEALFWLVAVARAQGIEPEGALRRATTSFRESF